MIKIDKKEVKALLFTEFGTYKMLDSMPTKTVLPWYLKDTDVLAFYVVDNDGFEKYIFLSGAHWIIKPTSEKSFTDVHSLAEENIKVDSQE